MNVNFMLVQCVLSFWGLVFGIIIGQMAEEPPPFVLKEPPKERPPPEAFK